jgi:hypothetical protein
MQKTLTQGIFAPQTDKLPPAPTRRQSHLSDGNAYAINVGIERKTNNASKANAAE